METGQQRGPRHPDKTAYQASGASQRSLAKVCVKQIFGRDSYVTSSLSRSQSNYCDENRLCNMGIVEGESHFPVYSTYYDDLSVSFPWNCLTKP